MSLSINFHSFSSTARIVICWVISDYMGYGEALQRLGAEYGVSDMHKVLTLLVTPVQLKTPGI